MAKDAKQKIPKLFLYNKIACINLSEIKMYLEKKSAIFKFFYYYYYLILILLRLFSERTISNMKYEQL